MKFQQVTVNYWSMVTSSVSYLVLAFSGWLLFKLVQAVFWLPGYLQKNQHLMYKKLEERSEFIISKYEKIPDEPGLVDSQPLEGETETKTPEPETNLDVDNDSKKTK